LGAGSVARLRKTMRHASNLDVRCDIAISTPCAGANLTDCEHVVEKRGQIEHKRRRGRLGLPRERAGHDFGPVVLWPPPLDDARIGVDDPILPHAFALIETALYLPIGARCRWRKDLDGKEQRADVGPLSGALPLC